MPRLTVDKEISFYAIIDGEKIGAEQLINEEYELQNDTGVVYDLKELGQQEDPEALQVGVEQ